MSAIEVRDGNMNRALRQLKRLLNRNGWRSDLERHREYEKPSERRRRRKLEAKRRAKKLAQDRARGRNKNHRGH